LTAGGFAECEDWSMQQLPLTVQTDSRKLVEDLYDFLGTIVRGWRLVAVCVGITMTLAVIYLARAKPVYQASARLLVLQHGGQPLNVTAGATNHDSLFQSVDGYSNTLTTHVMIIKSPLIVSRALATSGLKGVSAGSVIAGLIVKLPDPSARVLELSYKASSRDEAVQVVDSIIKSYDRFLQENYQKNSNHVLELITKARDELSADLKKLEREYLEYRQKSEAHPAGGDGKTFIARRLDQWDQAISQAMLRSLNLKSQLELGRTLAEDGAGVDVITSALGHVVGTPLNLPGTAESAPAAGLSDDRIEAQLGEIVFQRQTAESLLEHLRAEHAKAVADSNVSEDQVVKEFYAVPEIAERGTAYKRAVEIYNEAKRVSRYPNDPSVMHARKRAKELEEELGQSWQQMKPEIQARLAGGNADQIRQAANELMVLKAKEASLTERLDEFKTRKVVELEAKHARLAKRHGPGHAKVQEIREQISRLKGDADLASSDPRQAQSRALLTSIEQGLKSVEAMKSEVEQRFQQDLTESNKSEIGLLRESNLKNNLERQRVLFYSVVDQLKQAQLVSDFGSVSAQVLDPPVASESRPPIPMVLLAALVVGCALGVGAVYIADQLDARVRSLPEIRRLLDYRMLGVVPLLTRGQQGEVKVGLFSHVKPRSRLAETYKSIRTGIELIRRNWQGNVFMVTSAQPADGKSTTASNLAICMAQSGKKVLLVDADLRRPSQHTIHSLPRSPGMTHVLNDLMPFHMAVQPTAVTNLDLLAAGAEVSNPAELLATERLVSLAGELRVAYDIVIIDTSPLLVVTDPSIIAVAIDGMVLVVRASVTRRLDAERCQDLLKALQTPVLGLIINGINPGQRGYGYGYGYGYLYGYGAYGRSTTVGDGDDPTLALTSDRVTATAEAPKIGRNGTNGHPTENS
jgi:polysaccharide biosynthesis transport protein